MYKYRRAVIHVGILDFELRMEHLFKDETKNAIELQRTAVSTVSDGSHIHSESVVSEATIHAKNNLIHLDSINHK